MSPQTTKNKSANAEISPAWMTPQMEQWLTRKLGTNVGKTLGETLRLSSNARAAEKGRLVKKGDANSEVWKAANLLSYKSALEGMSKYLGSLSGLGDESLAKEFCEKFTVAPSEFRKFAKSVSRMHRDVSGDLKWANKPLKNYSRDTLRDAESLAKAGAAAREAGRKETAQASPEFVRPAAKKEVSASVPKKLKSEEGQQEASAEKTGKMVFTSNELYNMEDHLHTWIQKNMPGYSDFKKKVQEYTKIYDAAGKTLGYYYAKSGITEQEKEVIKVALDARKTYLEKLKGVYSETAKALPNLKKEFRESLGGVHENEYMALFGKWVSEVESVAKTSPYGQDKVLARKINHSPRSDAEASVAQMRKLQERSEKLWKQETQKAEEQLNIGAETIEMGIKAIGDAGLTLARRNPGEKSDSIKKVQKKFSEIRKLLDNARERGELSEEVADDLDGVLEDVKENFEKKIASLQEKSGGRRRA